MQLAIGQWLPDLPAHENPGALEMLNVIPAAKSARPLQSFTAVSTALTARCQGAFSCRDLTVATHNFAGDATKLYKLSSDGITWNDVTRVSGGAYATAADGLWSFSQFGNVVIAANGVDAPQAYTLGTSSNFAALAATAPVGKYSTTIRDFPFIGNVSSFNNRVQWGSINDPTGDWSVSLVTQADYQDIPDGGYVQGMVGGEAGVILQRNAVKRVTYIGPPEIFQFAEISHSIGCIAPGSIASYEHDCFFWSDNGFYQIKRQTELVRLGAEKFDRYFLSDLDQGYLHRISSAIDPNNSLYIVSYPGAGHSGGTPNKGLIYHWPSGRAARFEVDLEQLFTGYTQSGYTLDGLDAVSSSVDALPYSLDSQIWAGSGRLGLGAFSTAHKSGFFSGTAMAATVDTQEGQLFGGRRAFVRNIRPMIDGTTSVTAYMLTRDNQADDPVLSGAVSMNSIGNCPFRSNARYHRARMVVAAAADWTHIMGVDQIEASQVGAR
jgi:hypothetical protein